MRILFAAAEVDPFAKVGGLADVAAGLPRQLRALGHDVRVVTPCHASAASAVEGAALSTIEVATAAGQRTVAVAEVEGAGGVAVTLVVEGDLFGREVYGLPNDLERYLFFCRAVRAIVEDPAWTPDVLHLNDWHTAPLAFALRNAAWSNPALQRTVSVYTVHNLRYRGADDYLDLAGQAIYYSDAITAVSPAYAGEILGWEQSEGLQELLALRRDRLSGILNGLDEAAFDPATDTALAATFDATTIAARARNRAALLAEYGLAADDAPLLTMVARLTEQKGVDLVTEAVPALVALGARIVVLGDGDPPLVAGLRAAERRFPGHVRLSARYDEPSARRLYGGADMFLMPSRFEPCGLGQMIAMRYGCVPIGRRTGGLADTIAEYSEHAAGATGFLFDAFSAEALTAAVARALRVFADGRTWRALQENGMRRDFSWREPAERYLEVYRAAFRRRGLDPPA